ncbi:unnamed protein product [Darwinula stevensoni]|uniref:Tc1-like transposase DDE domain-containing protein n=1 Tax=Darwinula stevensoni TaxID=69355 RepID=A0A7R9AGM2_9CRUS|nr:unnamed protein product [Darwinula stevensoni]CAG0904198.1 unnamed protein product [Darwinula stevensoni]
MQLFLNEVSRRHPDEKIVMVMDGAGWHSSDKLKAPPNIYLLTLPPYAPELNPMEHVWDELREKFFHNQVFQSLDALEDHLVEALSARSPQEDFDDAKARVEEALQQGQQASDSASPNGEICGILLCMSGEQDGVAPHECKPLVEAYFKIRVYKKGTFKTRFDPIRTAHKRYAEVLESCDSAEQKDRDRVNAMFGTLEYSPFVYGN